MSLGWAKQDEWGQEWEALKDVFVAYSCTKIFFFWVVLSKPSIHLLILWSGHVDLDAFETRVYQIKDLMILCIVALIGKGLAIHMD